MNRICKKCNRSKYGSQFRHNRNTCRLCENAEKRNRRNKPKEKIMPRAKPINLPDGFYKIVEGVAVPVRKRKANIDTKYAFIKELGLSISHNGQIKGPCVVFEDDNAKIWASALHCAMAYGRKNNRTFIGRKIEGGYGIWRIK